MRLDLNNPLLVVLLLASFGLAFLTVVIPIMLVLGVNTTPMTVMAGIWGGVIPTVAGAAILRGRNGEADREDK